MPTTIQQYEGAGTIGINGRILAEATKFTWTISTNDNEVLTMRKGLAGFSDGVTKIEITIESAVPRVGLESPWFDYILKRKPVSATFKFGGKRVTVAGRFSTLDGSQDVSSAASATVKFVGGEPDARG